MEKPFAAYRGDKPYVFVCYAHNDAAVVYPELLALDQQAINIWYDEGISAGSNWRASIGNALLGASHVLVYISKHSVASAHCNREINLALDEGKQIVPIYLDEVELTPDLKVGFARVQALRYADQAAYRAKLLETLGSTEPLELTDTFPAKKAAGLNRWLSLAAVLAVCVVGWWWYSNAQQVDEAVQADERAIVVLPFENLSADPENGYLADGMSEELMTMLGRVPGLRIASRTSAFYYKDRPTELAEIGATLNVNYAIEGSVRRSGDDVRITSRLIRIADGSDLATNVFNQNTNSLLKLQTEVARTIVDALAVHLSKSKLETALQVGTDNEQAFGLFVRAQALMQTDNANDFTEARALFASAVELDPKFVRAYASLVTANITTAMRTGAFDEGYNNILEIGNTVDQLNLADDHPGLQEFHASLNFVARDWPANEQILRTQLIAQPKDSNALAMYGFILSDAGLLQASHDYLLLAAELDPFNPSTIERLGDMLLSMGRSSEAIKAYERCLELEPTRTGCYGQIGIALARQGKLEQVKKHFHGNIAPAMDCLLLDNLAACVPDEKIPFPTFNGYLAAKAGNLDTAFFYLNKAADLPFTFINFIRWQQLYNASKFEGPRYLELLNKINLSPEWQEKLCRHASSLTPVTGIVVHCSI